MKDNEYSEKQKFVLKAAEKAYEMEKERSKNILNQSEKLLLMQTFLLTALTFIYPLVNEMKDANETKELSEFLFYFTVVFFLISLALNLLSQWGFRTKTIPIPSNIENDIDKYLKINKLEYSLKTEYEAIKGLWDDILGSMRKTNNIKAVFLCTSMITLFVSIVLLICFGFPLLI